ncbi:MAG TPA: hypothetical protein VGQ03_03010 [Nitrososphaera sp.]|jgi:hypothetical protein|nr:hypothetical protein [Nitrososphaera sp.]
MADTNPLIPRLRRLYGITNGRAYDDVRFIICNSCFWCTSLLYGYRISALSKCPRCSSSMIESISIEPDERYLFNHNEKSGVILEYRNLIESELEMAN